MNQQRSRQRGKGRLAIVSAFALNPLTPRGQRTQHLVESLKRDWEIELIALPSESFSGSGAALERRAWWRRLASAGVRVTLLDKWEPWSWRTLHRWQPDADAALLVAWPWSPAVYAARRLARAGIPFAVDVGDPWVLTSSSKGPRLLAGLRASHAERSIWTHAAGTVITTGHQRDMLAALFPLMPTLVQPNGYDPVPQASPAGPAASRDPERLRLVHYGALSEPRIDVTSLLSKLVRSARWRSISFAQFGADHVGMLRRAPAEVEVERHAARPWAEVVANACRYDLAIVVGNRRSGQLPSKAIQYMTLPIPRLALTKGEGIDALADYVQGRPGWLGLGDGDPDAARRVYEHVERRWSAEELAPPPDEAWPVVADRVAYFVTDCLRVPGAQRVEPHGDRQAPATGRGA